MPGDDLDEHGIEFVANKLEVAGIGELGARGFEEPVRCLHRVVFGVSPASENRLGNVP
jgi:hypothetical protein